MKVKRTLGILGMVFCLIFISVAVSAAPKEMDLHISDPGGSAEWAVGSTNTIKWNLKGEWSGNVSISIQRVGLVNARMVIVETAPIGVGKTGSYKWATPADLPIGENYSITVTADNGIGETSAEFKVVQGKGTPSKLVIDALPKNGDKWTQGAVVPIRWSYAGNLGSTVKLVLMNKDEGIVAVIAEVASVGTGGKGQFQWTVPANIKPGNDYRVGIASLTNPFFQDTSKEPITIMAVK